MVAKNLAGWLKRWVSASVARGYLLPSVKFYNGSHLGAHRAGSNEVSSSIREKEANWCMLEEKKMVKPGRDLEGTSQDSLEYSGGSFLHVRKSHGALSLAALD